MDYSEIENMTKPDYVVKNGWLLCKIAVVDRKLNDMDIDTPSVWERAAYRIDSIVGFRANSDKDSELVDTVTLSIVEDSFTVNVQYDDMLKIMGLE